MAAIFSDLLQEKRIVLSIMGMTVHNGPGIRTLILFKQCPLRCIWCSTPESQKPEPEIAVEPGKCTGCGKCVPVCPLNAIRLTENGFSINRLECNSCGECTKVCYPEAIRLLGRYMTVEELLKEVGKDVLFYKHSGGGVVLCGGEPLLNPKFNRIFTEACRREGISVGVDTCGYVPWSNIEQILPNVDYFLYDVKHMDSRKHRQFTGVPNDLVLSNARSISAKGIPIYLRVPIIPGYTDSEDNIKAISDFATNLHSLVEIHLLPVHHLGSKRYEMLNRPYALEGVPLVDEHVVQGFKELFESHGMECSIVS